MVEVWEIRVKALYVESECEVQCRRRHHHRWERRRRRRNTDLIARRGSEAVRLMMLRTTEKAEPCSKLYLSFIAPKTASGSTPSLCSGSDSDVFEPTGRL